MIKKIIIISIICGLLLPSFSFAQPQSLQTPETLEEAKEMGEKALEVSKKELPGILEKIWKEDVLPVWQKMYEKWSEWWDSSIQPWLQNIWEKITVLFGKEIEKRRPIIEEEFEKEKEEIKEELPKVTKSLWEKFKELLK
jgi:hypothetical protein